jgi:hypothetical protein
MPSLEPLLPLQWPPQTCLRVCSHCPTLPAPYGAGTACACAGYCVRHFPLSSVLPQARSLRRPSSSWCPWLSHAPTPLPQPTPVRTSGVSLGSRFPPLHFPAHAPQVSRVPHEGRQRHAVGGVWLHAPSPLGGSPIFLQGQIRVTWSPRRSHPLEETGGPAWPQRRMAGSTG